MPFTTPGQFVILAVLLLAGWLLGYASAPSARKWKRRMRAQSDSFTAYHGDTEDKLRAANQRAADLKAEADALRADHAEAERTITALRAAAAQPASAAETADAAHVAQDQPARTPGTPLDDIDPPAPDEPAPEALVAGEAEAMPAAAVEADKHWFGSVMRDDLTRIHGIDGSLSTRLFSLGVVRFEDIEQLSVEDEMALEQRLALPVGYIAREQWRTQAALLHAGEDEDHAVLFGVVETGR